MVYCKIPFQKWRIFWFGMKQAGAAGAADDPALKEAHKQMANLATEAIKAIDAGPRAANAFVERLDREIEAGRGNTGNPELDEMLRRAREQRDYKQ